MDVLGSERHQLIGGSLDEVRQDWVLPFGVVDVV
jgi:hypothetical protein